GRDGRAVHDRRVRGVRVVPDQRGASRRPFRKGLVQWRDRVGAVMRGMPLCDRCDESHWVCEAHDNVPWLACNCGAPGMLCPDCGSESHPNLPPGFTVDDEWIDKAIEADPVDIVIDEFDDTPSGPPLSPQDIAAARIKLAQWHHPDTFKFEVGTL